MASKPLLVNPALDLVRAGPASVAAGAGPGAGGAADRGISLVVQRVVGELVLVDVAPQVLLAPVGQRIHLPDSALLVTLELGRRRPRGGLLPANAGDPGVYVVQRPLQGVDLDLAAAALERPRLLGAAGLEHLHPQAEPVLELLPGGQRLRKQ